MSSAEQLSMSTCRTVRRCCYSLNDLDVGIICPPPHHHHHHSDRDYAGHIGLSTKTVTTVHKVPLTSPFVGRRLVQALYESKYYSNIQCNAIDGDYTY